LPAARVQIAFDDGPMVLFRYWEHPQDQATFEREQRDPPWKTIPVRLRVASWSADEAPPATAPRSEQSRIPPAVRQALGGMEVLPWFGFAPKGPRADAWVCVGHRNGERNEALLMPLAPIAPWVCDDKHVTIWLGTREEAADSSILLEHRADADADEVTAFLRGHGVTASPGTRAVDEAIQTLLLGRPADPEAERARAALDRIYRRADAPYGGDFLDGASSVSFILPLDKPPGGHG
jgi:hypothetical protein